MSGQGHPLDDRTRNRIVVLAIDGHRNTDIARICGVCGKTVQRIRHDIQEQKRAKPEEKI